MSARPKRSLWKVLVDEMVGSLHGRLKAQDARIAALERRIAEFKYCGVWRGGAVYRQHNSVTDGGSLWICVSEETTQRPGDGPDWRLAVKRGKDGRGAQL